MPQHLGPLVRFLHSAIDKSVNATVEEMDLTSAQGHIMGYVAHQKAPPCPRDIEEAFHLSHPTVSGLLSRLEQKGFIAMKPDENDRRCKRISILPKGAECTERIHQSIVATEEKLLEGFSQEEREQFRSLLARAIQNVGGWPKHPNHKEENLP